MDQYIGTKIIEAAPAVRKGGKVYDLTWPIPRSMEPEEPGYRVRYQDGYESWSPKDVFEEAYRRTDAMTFGMAIEAARKGRKIARKGWNGKGQYVELATGISYVNPTGEIINASHEVIGNRAFAFVGTSGGADGVARLPGRYVGRGLGHHRIGGYIRWTFLLLGSREWRRSPSSAC